MIRLNKRPLPDGVTITREEDYRCGVVFTMLIEDCLGKCYICEDCLHTAPNVEHIIPHKGNAALKYDWNNLLMACSHCNSIKWDKYDGIINPTQMDPEQVIELSLDVDEELREMVIVRKIGDGEAVDITVSLLKAVYNDAKTDMKKYSCRQLKDKLSNELWWFRQKLDEYKRMPDHEHRAIIEQKLAAGSVFAAFKRTIVRNEPELSKVFVFQA